MDEDVQARVNARLWARRDLVSKYANRQLRPPEVIVLARYAEAFSGRVLELGCGAGRLTGYLAEIARAAHGIDVNPAMLDYCRNAYPKVIVEQRDMRDLEAFEDASFDTVIAPFNVVDVLGDEDRGALLDDLHRILAPAGLLVVCTHNRAAQATIPASLNPLTTLRHHGPARAAITLVRLPRFLRNRRRLVPRERREPRYAIFNDVSHDYQALHYYIARDAQEEQLTEHGFALLECLDREGRPVAAGDDAPGSTDLHYVARRRG
jgi:SAM-dependent methyltransferase